MLNAVILLGLLIPFIGTVLGAALVFVLRKNISENLQKSLTGFAAGVMWQHLSGACCSRCLRVAKQWVHWLSFPLWSDF